MFASVTSIALVGVRPLPVLVEARVADAAGKGLFTIVGLPDTAVREAKERVRAAMAGSGYEFPQRRVIVNLSPADLPKAGAAYDLPIALAVLAAAGFIDMRASRVVCLGELALDGKVRPVRGALAAALVARRNGLRCVLPTGSGSAAWSLDDVDIRTIDHLGGCRIGGRRPSAGESVSGSARVRPGTARSLRCAWHGRCPARGRDSGGRRSSHLAQRPSRRGKDHAGTVSSWDHPAVGPVGRPRGGAGMGGGRAAPGGRGSASFSPASSLGNSRRHGWRWQRHARSR